MDDKMVKKNKTENLPKMEEKKKKKQRRKNLGNEKEQITVNMDAISCIRNPRLKRIGKR